MSKDDERYFNFPITLLQGFLVDDKKVLDKIFDYALYNKAMKLEFGNNEDKMIAALDYFNVEANVKATLTTGKLLHNLLSSGLPTVGINKEIWFDFYKNEKTDFQKVTLLGFLAIKSILQNKSYCKLDNNFWLSRMDGKAKSVKEIFELSDELQRYSCHYQMRKIKTELELNWGLKTVSGRGFNVSFQMSLQDLTYEVLKKRKNQKEKELRDQKEKAKQEAYKRLNNSQP